MKSRKKCMRASVRRCTKVTAIHLRERKTLQRSRETLSERVAGMLLAQRMLIEMQRASRLTIACDSSFNARSLIAFESSRIYNGSCEIFAGA
jgi:hypothetical protein